MRSLFVTRSLEIYFFKIDTKSHAVFKEHFYNRILGIYIEKTSIRDRSS